MHFSLAASAIGAAFISSASSLAIADKETVETRGLTAGWSYYGCIERPPSAEVTLVDQIGMTREVCASYCQGKSYNAAGLSGGNTCHCWDDNGSKFSHLANAECTLPCAGNAQEICGGRKGLSVLIRVEQSSSKELRSKHVRKRKCGGVKTPVSSSSVLVSSGVPAVTDSTAKSSSTLSTSLSMTITSASADPEFISAVSSQTSSSDVMATMSSSVTSSDTVSDVPTSTSSSDTTTGMVASTISSEILTTPEATATSSGSMSETSAPDATTTSSSSESDTTSSDITTSTFSTTSSEGTTTSSGSISETTTSDVVTSTSTTMTSEVPTSATVTGPCATITGTFVLQGSGTGDFAVDGNFAQLQSTFGSGYRTTFSTNRQNAQQFRFNADCTFSTSEGRLLAMVGGNANLHYQYFFPSVEEASALVNVSWEADLCSMNADNTLACTAMQQSIFQVTEGDPLLEIGDQNYGEVLTINLIPVPTGSFD